jgi:hypothetical protein
MFKAFGSFGALSRFQLTVTRGSKIYTGFSAFEHVELFPRISKNLRKSNGYQAYEKDDKLVEL